MPKPTALDQPAREPACQKARMYQEGGGYALRLVRGVCDVFPGSGQCTSRCISYEPLAFGEKPPLYRPAGKISWPGHTRTIVNPGFGWKSNDEVLARGER